MSHDHQHEHGENCGHSHSHSHGKKFHRDWRVWVAVIIMLGAMLIYVLTLDNSVVPGKAGNNPPPPVGASPTPP